MRKDPVLQFAAGALLALATCYAVTALFDLTRPDGLAAHVAMLENSALN